VATIFLLTPLIMARNVRFTRIISMTDRMAAQLQALHFTGFHVPAATWQPAVNVYSYADRLDVCVDLAGVSREELAVNAEPRRLVIRGCRTLPDSGGGQRGGGRILIMEIPDGSFERVLEFSVEIDPVRVVARQENGWLWISLPRVNEEVRP